MAAKIAVILDITESYPPEVEKELEEYWRQWDDKGQNTFQNFYMEEFGPYQHDDGTETPSEDMKKFGNLYRYVQDYLKATNLDPDDTDVFIHIWW